MPRKARRKPLIWLWRLLTVWMCSAHPLAGRGVDALVRDVERRRDGRIAAVGVGDEQRIRGEDRLQHVLHAVCVQRRQGMAEGRAAAVGGDQDRHLLAREAALLGLAAAPARLALQLPLPLPALKDEGLVRLDDPRKPVRRLAHRRQEAVAPAMRRARRNPAALGRPLDRLACAKRGAKGKPTLLVVQPGQCRARQRTKCLPALLAPEPAKTARLATRHRPAGGSDRTAATSLRCAAVNSSTRETQSRNAEYFTYERDESL